MTLSIFVNIYAVLHHTNPDLAHTGLVEKKEIQKLLEVAIKEVAQNRGLTLLMNSNCGQCL